MLFAFGQIPADKTWAIAYDTLKPSAFYSLDGPRLCRRYPE